MAEATADFDRAIELDPHFAEAFCNRGVTRYGKGDLAGATADFDRAITLNPRLAEAYANRGLTRLAQGQEAEAQRDFEQCLILNKDLKPVLDERIKEVKRRLAANQ